MAKIVALITKTRVLIYSSFFLHVIRLNLVVKLLLSSVGTMSTSSSTGSVVITAPNDLYLFVFQTACGVGRRGAADIVIIDKPVLLHGAPCKCRKYEIVEEMDGVEFVGGAVESYLWPEEDQGD